MFPTNLKFTRGAVAGALVLGIAVAASSVTIARAGHVLPDKSKTYTCSSGTACVAGSSTGGHTWAVYAISTIADGVHGVTASTSGNSGVTGLATGTSGTAHGIFGRSSNGDGVYGITTQNDGLSSGVYGIAGNGWGLAGVSDDTSGNYAAIAGVGNDSATNLFFVDNSATNGSCFIDRNGNLSCTGTITSSSSLRVRQQSSRGRRVLAYTPESASATIEDVGARMVDGVANVQIGSDFASVMDRGWYYVFLTPLGDTRGLYVSAKTPAAFQVRETSTDAPRWHSITGSSRTRSLRAATGYPPPHANLGSPVSRAGHRNRLTNLAMQRNRLEATSQGRIADRVPASFERPLRCAKRNRGVGDVA
jgi:hypothetical protein